MKTKRLKLLTAILAPALILLATPTVYATGADLPCDGSHFDLTATEGDSVSFSSSAGATNVNLSDGQSVSVPGTSGPLSAGTVTFSDDCGDSGTITVSAAPPPPPGGGGSVTPTPPPSSITKPPSSTPAAKPPATPPAADPTSTLSANTNQPNHSGRSTSVLGAKSASRTATSGQIKVGLFEKVMIAAAALIFIGSIFYGFYYLIKRLRGRKMTAIRRNHAQPTLQMPAFQVPVEYKEPEVYRQPVYRYSPPPANSIGGPSAIGG